MCIFSHFAKLISLAKLHDPTFQAAPLMKYILFHIECLFNCPISSSVQVQYHTPHRPVCLGSPKCVCNLLCNWLTQFVLFSTSIIFQEVCQCLWRLGLSFSSYLISLLINAFVGSDKLPSQISTRQGQGGNFHSRKSNLYSVKLLITLLSK